MSVSSAKKEARLPICPYLRQLDADWLSMDADGFYCHGKSGHTKVFRDAEDVARCAVAGFTSCSEYKLILRAAKAR